MKKIFAKKFVLGTLSLIALIGGVLLGGGISFKTLDSVSAASGIGINTPIDWTATAFGSTDNVALETNVQDVNAYGGEADVKATISSSTQTTGVKISFEETVNLDDYAHVFVRWKNYNESSVGTATLRVGIDAEPQAGTQAYPFYDATENGTAGALYYESYFSYDIKDMVADGVTTINSLYIGRVGGSISSGSIALYIDHIDFVKDALKLDNVTSIKNAGQNKTYNVSEEKAWSNAAVLSTNGSNAAVSAWKGWDIDIYNGKYAFVGNFGVSSTGTFDTRALTLNFDGIDLTNYANVKVRMKNYNTDSTYATNCTAYMKLNGDFWTSEQSQNNGGGIPKADWNLNPIAHTGHTEEQMRSTYFEYDLLTMASYPNPLESITICRGNNVNGTKMGIIMYIESVEFVPYIEQKIDTIKLGKAYNLQEVFTLADCLSDKADELSLEGYLNTTTPNGVLTNFGSFTSGTISVSKENYDAENNTFSVCLAVRGINSALGKTGYAMFVFKVDDSLGVSYTGYPFIVGVDIDFGLLFNTEGLVTAKECTVNGVPVEGDSIKVTKKGEYTVKYSITNGKDSKELTVVVKAMDISLQSEISGEFEKDKLEIFADPALPFDGVQYTTKLYKATDDITTATPITTNSNYVFTESGAYKLIYEIYFLTVDKSISFETIYNVSIVEQKPIIQLNGSLEETYYTGTTLELPTATAANSYQTYAVSISAENDGAEILVSDGKIVLATAGEYKIVYSVMYDTNAITQEVLSFIVLSDTNAPEILIDGRYDEHYDAGEIIEILRAKIIDDSNAFIEANVSIFKGKRQITAQEGKLLLEDGTYSIVYSASDATGNTAEIALSFTVGTGINAEDEKNSGCKSSLDSLSALIMIILIPMTIFIAKKEEKNYD